MSEHSPSMRCDVWLFRTRLYKSRGLAGQMVEKGAVRIDRNGKISRLRVTVPDERFARD